METLLYIGKVSLFWILFYACYQLFLRKQTFFVWNRAYLLSSLLASFLLPLVVYPESAPEMPVMYEVSAGAYSISYQQPEQVSIFTWVNAFIFFYLLAVGRRALVFFNNIRQLSQYIKAGEIIELEDCKVVLIDSNEVGSFSFLKWIVVNRNDYENHFDAILRHEMVHTAQGHSYDILFIEILSMVFWFNPILKGYKHSLQEVHEYLADEAAPNREHYARFLLAYSLNAPIAALTNHFFKPSQLKGRIQMIYKNRSAKWLRSSYLLAFTFMGAVALLIAGCERITSDVSKDISAISGQQIDSSTSIKGEVANQQNAKKDQEVTEDKVFTVVEKQPIFPGGIRAMYDFLGDNIKYPSAAANANVTGRVFLSFIVDASGAIRDVTVLKGIGFGCDEEAVRVVSKFPKWNPGMQDGKPVSVKYNLPIMFQIDDDNKKGSVSGKKTAQSLLKKGLSKKIDNAVGAESEHDFARSTTAPALPDDLGKIIYQQSSPAISVRGGIPNYEDLNPPLYILDGKVIERSDFNKILGKMPTDNIESISVLKGSSASSTYGKKGENGVILITSKKRTL
jgi:TonB family protein